MKVRTLYLSFFKASVICSLLEDGFRDQRHIAKKSPKSRYLRRASTDRSSQLGNVCTVDFQAEEASRKVTLQLDHDKQLEDLPVGESVTEVTGSEDEL